jgi:hypothetical protein
MSGAAAARTACQTIQLSLCTGSECSSLFVPYMDPLDFAVAMYSGI